MLVPGGTESDDSELKSTAREPRTSRGRWLVGWVAGCLVATTVAFLVGTRVHSPWDEAIDNSRAVQQVTAAVEQRTLTLDESTILGSVALGSSTDVRPRGEGPWVLTATPHAQGTEVKSGDVLVEVSGRPLLGLDLPFALYRDLAPGDEGTDVEAVQSALAGLGLYSGHVDGEYGSGTASAVTSLYERAGVEVPEITPEVAEAVTTAEDALEGARSALLVAQEEAQTAEGSAVTGPTSPVTRAQADVDAAIVAVAAARTAALQPLPMTEVFRLPEGAVRVLSVPPVGTEVADDAGVLITLQTGSPTAGARVSLTNAAAFEPGTEVTVTSVTDASITTLGTVSSVGAFVSTPTESGSPPGHDVAITLQDPAGLSNGSAVTVAPHVALPAITGHAVPVLALREDADGTYVSVVAPESATARVDVEVVGSAEGFAVVEGALADGDQVIVTEGT